MGLWIDWGEFALHQMEISVRMMMIMMILSHDYGYRGVVYLSIYRRGGGKVVSRSLGNY